MPERRTLPIPDGLAGERVDLGLSRMLGISRTQAAEFVAQARVVIAGQLAQKSDRLVAGDLLEIELPDPPAVSPPQPVPGLTTIFEDEDLIAVDKPVGVAAHPSPGWEGPTVSGGLQAAGVGLSDLGPAERQGVVHRLDVGTSGIMVLAKSPHGYRNLKRQFKERTVTKIYHALVQGHPDPSTGTIDAPIGRHPSGDHRFAVVAEGKPSVTHYETLEAFRFASLIRVRLETGRTHQIRVHMAATRHPCVGDLAYGADPVLADRLGLRRQWLHAVRLEILQPTTDELIVLESPYPADLAEALARLAD